LPERVIKASVVGPVFDEKLTSSNSTKVIFYEFTYEDGSKADVWFGLKNNLGGQVRGVSGISYVKVNCIPVAFNPYTFEPFDVKVFSDGELSSEIPSVIVDFPCPS